MASEGGLETRDPGFRQILVLAARAAVSQANVLVTGESGTGKNRLARYIHDCSLRSGAPFVELSCANLPPELAESELFGHERGAFTDAHDARAGRFEQADGGTLHLDEVQELGPEIQAKVLRAVQERRFERLGGDRTLEVDVRFIASTREDPEGLVRSGRLREDLFYRLDVVRLHLPALRHRAADIPLLARIFLDQAVRRHRLGRRRFEDEVLDRLRRYPWPGNVRELQHAVESAAILAAGERITVADLPASLSVASPANLGLAAADRMSLPQLEAAYIREVLARTRGNKSAAARILGIHRKTLHDKLRALEREAVATEEAGDA